MNDDTTNLVIEIAKEFMTFLQGSGTPWAKGYFRFRSEALNFGSSASFTNDGNTFLISAMKNATFFSSINEKSRRLIESMKKDEGLFLLIVDDLFNYDIKFEWSDLNKWEITKMDGGTGVPMGV